MLGLRDLDCLLALARYKHFAKAAEHCGLSQPAFSMRIRNLEAQLDTQIVKGGNRYEGLTHDGEMILAHARAIMQNVRALEEEVRAAHGDLSGALKVGVIPTAAPFVAHIAARMNETYPGITMTIESTSSLAIQQGVDDGRFDAGFTYTEGASEDLLEVTPLYDERYVLMAPAALIKDHGNEISWAQAAALPLILLDREMQNRRIIDGVFDAQGVHPTVMAESNGFISALAMSTEGMGATVIPEALFETLGDVGGCRGLSLTDPRVEKSVALVTKQGDLAVPVVQALKRIAAPPKQ